MNQNHRILIGLNGRFFPENWRPALHEIAFARDVGFAAMQVVGAPSGLNCDYLGASFADVAQALRAAHITSVMEIVLRLDENGRTPQGHTPLQTLLHNLPAITALGCTCVHWHLTMGAAWPDSHSPRLERELYSQIATAVRLGQRHGFRMGLEHNAPDSSHFLHTAQRMNAALTAVPGLVLVWDWNHVPAEEETAFRQLAPRVSMLHVSDTPLPTVNWHWPLGKGSVDLVGKCQTLLTAGFHGPAILEIGGLPASGGFGQDTDEALIASRQRLADAIELAAQEANLTPNN